MSTALIERCRELVRGYLRADGCPCRYPRFRSIARRDTSKSLGLPSRGEDQIALIAAFEALAPIGTRSALGPYSAPVEGMWQATCLRCSSQLERSSNEFAPGGWADYLVIRRASTATDLGAQVNQVYRCRPLIPLGQGTLNMRDAARLYPFIEEDAWFDWLRER